MTPADAQSAGLSSIKVLCAPLMRKRYAARLESMLKRNAFLIAFLVSIFAFGAVNLLIYFAVKRT